MALPFIEHTCSTHIYLCVDRLKKKIQVICDSQTGLFVGFSCYARAGLFVLSGTTALDISKLSFYQLYILQLVSLWKNPIQDKCSLKLAC